MGRGGCLNVDSWRGTRRLRGLQGPCVSPGWGLPGLGLCSSLCAWAAGREMRGSLAAWGGVSAWSSQVVQCELPDTEYRTRVLRPVVLVMAFLHWSASGVPAAH